MKTFFSGCLSLIISLPLAAQTNTLDPQKISGFYLGAGIGNPSSELDGQDIGLKDRSYHIISGYQFNRIVAVEMQYASYGESTYGLPIPRSSKTLPFDPVALSMSANLGYSFDNGVRPFAVFGLGITKLGFAQSDSVQVISDSDLSYHYGVGVDFAPKSLTGVTFRLSYESDFVNIEQQVYLSNGKSSLYAYSEIYDVDLHSVYGAVMYKF